MPDAETVITPEAYSVLFLHACKYPHRAVNGLLIGTSEGSTVHVTKTLPLFHSHHALLPMLEAALVLVRPTGPSEPPLSFHSRSPHPATRTDLPSRRHGTH